ncbi:UBC-like protein [Sporormia fimetaria CBS 119925]|uniref:UBC-like protein n=1 Tax=Sporormia fimetaria CBS 119925 TaxID=1340428 RepID=A0A6A6VIX6_9PLEO|nr:UBC-like protein [Sporormia fimetaria CBS 119925]
MAPPHGPIPVLTSFRRQQLLVEFASLSSLKLEGVFVTITPGDATLWAGVMFVRKGPYSPAVLRFQISFPPNYPASPPLVTFSTDVFHPLLTPLTTYTYTTGSSESDTVSATDEGRLPPGGFSLRHGFPHWFAHAPKSAASSREVSGSAVNSKDQRAVPSSVESGTTMVQVLEYIRSTFSDEAVLDSVELEAAANPGAYHAWRAYRAAVLRPSSPASQSTETRAADTAALGRNRRPGEWNWEGVWEERVRKAVRQSLSEPMLFGAGVTGDDLIRFQDMDEEGVSRMKKSLEGVVASAVTG